MIGAYMEHKLARLCWNHERWKQPTGFDGKSKDPRSYERSYGFGHEEWLFDTSKVIDGYVYGYVTAIARSRAKYQDQCFDLSLYSINGETMQRWWIGTVRNITVVGPDESRSVYEYYKKHGWLDEMRAQVRSAGADIKAFNKFCTPEIFSVLKFRIEDLELLEEPLEFRHNDPAVKSDRYTLKNFVDVPELPALETEAEFVPGHRPATKKLKMSYSEHERSVNDYHVDVQNALFERLCKKHGKENVRTEYPTGVGSRADAAVRTGKKTLSLYEIKIGPSLRACVREAVGQLLEYRHHIGSSKVTKLIIVTPHKPEAAIECYLETMRTDHKIPLHYEQCLP